MWRKNSGTQPQHKPIYIVNKINSPNCSNILRTDLEEFRACLKKKFTNKDLEIIQRVCESIVDIRNRITHREVLTINQEKNIEKK